MRTLSLAAVLAWAAAPAAGQPDPKAKADHELLQGTWVIVGLESGGKAQPDKNYRGNTFTFGKEKVTLKEGNHPPLDFTFALDPGKAPKTIDLAGKSVALRGVYKLDGDDLTLCLGIGPTRPAEFATRPGGDTEVFVLRRNRWERFAEKGAGFTVEMPGKPDERKREATTVRVVKSDTERVTYAVAVTPLPAKPDPDQARAAREAALAVAVAEAADGAKAAVESDAAFKAEGKGGYAGRELALELDVPGAKDKSTGRARQFVAGDRLFTLLAVGNEDAMKAASVTRFWTSFRPVPDKK